MINRYNQNPSESIITGNRENDKDNLFDMSVQRSESRGNRREEIMKTSSCKYSPLSKMKLNQM